MNSQEASSECLQWAQGIITARPSDIQTNTRQRGLNDCGPRWFGQQKRGRINRGLKLMGPQWRGP